MPANGRWDLIRCLKVNVLLHLQVIPNANITHETVLTS
jgi:hypothetical protein